MKSKITILFIIVAFSLFQTCNNPGKKTGDAFSAAIALGLLKRGVITSCASIPESQVKNNKSTAINLQGFLMNNFCVITRKDRIGLWQ